MQSLLLALAALAVIIVASLFSRRTGVAAPLILLVLGIGAAFIPGIPSLAVEPEWILAGVLPPLLYASAVRMPTIDLRRNLAMISWLSVVLVVGTALAVGSVVHALVPQIPLAMAIALGAVISPTDAVAATAIGKRLGLPSRLMTVLEGESLVNDASALVVLRTAVAALAGSFSVGQAVGDFAWAVVAAIAVGLVIGFTTVAIRRRLDDPVLTTAMSFAVPFVAYLPAERLEASGVLAVVVAGLVTGHKGTKLFSARDRQSEATNWATIQFLLEGAVFGLMGLQLPGLLADLDRGEIGSVALIAAVSFGLLVIIRVVGVAIPLLIQRLRPANADRQREQLDQFGAKLDQLEAEGNTEQKRVDGARRRLAGRSADLDFAANEAITGRGGVVIAWAGMRGVVTLAAAQSIPIGETGRASVVVVAFIVAVASLLLFGLTLPWLLHRLRFSEPSTAQTRSEMMTLMGNMMTKVTDRLGPIGEQTIDGKPIDPALAERLVARFTPPTRELESGDAPAPAPPPDDTREQMMILQRRYLAAMRDALVDEQAIGAFRTETYAKVRSMLDQQEATLEVFRP